MEVLPGGPIIIIIISLVHSVLESCNNKKCNIYAELNGLQRGKIPFDQKWNLARHELLLLWGVF